MCDFNLTLQQKFDSLEKKLDRNLVELGALEKLSKEIEALKIVNTELKEEVNKMQQVAAMHDFSGANTG